MTSEQFAYWMQGFVELNGEMPTAEQWQSIKDHLKTVFVKVTPAVYPAPLIPNLPKMPSYLDRINLPLDQVKVIC